VPTFLMDRRLPPTATYRSRWYFLAIPAGEHLGRVRMKQDTKEDTYLIDWIPDSELKPGFKGISFHNIGRDPTPDRPGHYQVIIEAHTLTVVSCDCKASQCYRQDVDCRHKAVVADLIESGIFQAGDLSELEEVGTLY
jgi:hypothetical protein